RATSARVELDKILPAANAFAASLQAKLETFERVVLGSLDAEDAEKMLSREGPDASFRLSGNEVSPHVKLAGEARLLSSSAAATGQELNQARSNLKREYKQTSLRELALFDALHGRQDKAAGRQVDHLRSLQRQLLETERRLEAGTLETGSLPRLAE